MNIFISSNILSRAVKEEEEEQEEGLINIYSIR